MYYHSLEITGEIQERVGRVANSNHLILGRETEEFERAVDEQLFVDHDRKSLLVSNGTVAIELVLRTYRQRSDDLYVLMPVMTVPMVKWAIERANCVPVPIDVEPESHCMDVGKAIANMEEMKAGRGHYPLAVLFVYTGAMMPRDLTRLITFCRKQGVHFIEDVSHAYRTIRHHDGLVPGTVGNAVCGSLFATKVLSVGEAGLVRFDDMVDYSVARTIRHQGKNQSDVMVMDGYNFRASEYTSAVANVKLKFLHKEIAYRHAIIDEVYRQFAQKHNLTVPHDELGIQHSYYKFVLRYRGAYDDELAMKRQRCPVSGAVHRDILFDAPTGSDWTGALDVQTNHICPPLSSVSDAQEFVRMYEEIRFAEILP